MAPEAPGAFGSPQRPGRVPAGLLRPCSAVKSPKGVLVPSKGAFFAF